MVSEVRNLHQESEDLTEHNQAAMEHLMVSKATELFSLCDTEEKGFITKRDMQRLTSQLPVSPDQLEIVFDSLDVDQNGYLTLQEFTEGFGSFMGMKARSGGEAKPRGDSVLEEGEEEEGADVFEGQGGQKADVSKVFGDMMMQIDARGVFQDEGVVRAMWTKLHDDDPDLLSSFEDFLSRTAQDVKKSRGEFRTLESVLKTKANEHEEEVKKLYEEMEFQMKREQQRILAQEKAKEKQLREEMENELKEKERQLMEMQNRHQELEEKLAQIHLSEVTTKQDNQRLLQEKDELEELLTESQDSLEESRSYITLLQAQQRDEKKERARSSNPGSTSGSKMEGGEPQLDPEKPPAQQAKKGAALQMSEGIALERESLVKQLDMLKNVNKKLLDDKDEAEAIEARRALAQQAEEPQNHRKLVKQGSLLSKYFPGGPSPCRQRSEVVSEDLEGAVADLEDDGIEMDDMTDDAQIFTFHQVNHAHTGSDLPSNHTHTTRSAMVHAHSTGSATHAHSTGSATHAPDGGHHSDSKDGTTLMSRNHDFGRLMQEDSYTSDAESDAAVKRNGQLGSQTESTADQQEGEAVVPVQRIFKVVFVGDSGVGKSSFIHRFCSNSFRANFSATIGVDFQVKPMLVGDTMVILQLWDTAGQERFRSVTKQYFRKADGVIVMYDVTSERSFLNVREWMDSVQIGVEEGTVIAIIGNKTDIVEADPENVTKVEHGSKMAVEYDALFYETSAKSGSYVSEAMLGLASLLKDKEDKAMEAALKLTDVPKKKGCCR